MEAAPPSSADAIRRPAGSVRQFGASRARQPLGAHDHFGILTPLAYRGRVTRASVSKQRRGVAAIVWAAAIFGLAGCSTTTPTSHVTPTVTTTPAEFAGCEPSNLSVVAATDQDRYIAGAPVHIRITFRNHGGAPCSLRPGKSLHPSFEVRARDGQVVGAWATA